MQDADGKSFHPQVANLALELWNGDATQRLASSDDAGNNIEHIWLPAGLKAGRYILKVTSLSDFAENYGLAWRNSP